MALTQRHRLQRLSSPSRDASAFLHLLGLASNIYSFHFLTANPNKINESYGWHFQYLTIVGLTFTTSTFVTGLLADLTLSPALFAVKNTLSFCAAPMELLISLLYWGLRAIDEKLVLPPDLPRLPMQADLSFHLIPALTLVVDLIFFSPPYALASLPAFGLSSVIAVAYYFWVEHCHEKNGFYPYPLFDEVGYAGRLALFAGSALVMGCGSALLKWLYGTVNGYETVVPQPEKKRRT